MTKDTEQEFLQLVVATSTRGCWHWLGDHGTDGRPVFRGEKAYRVMYELRKGKVPLGFHVHHKCENASCVNPKHLVALSPEEHVAVHSTKDKSLREQIYRGEWEQVKVTKAEEVQLEKAQLERERLQAVRLEKARLERERLERVGEQERLAEIERQTTEALSAEDRRVTGLRRARRATSLRKFCVYGISALAFGSLVLGLLAYLEDKSGFPTSDRSIPLFLGILASLFILFSLLAIEGRGKNLFPGVNLPGWQLHEIAKHRRLRQKTDLNKIVWTRTSERVAMTELKNHWARVACGSNAQFDFFVYSKDSGRIACSWCNYDTEQKAMRAAVDFMRDGKEPG